MVLKEDTTQRELGAREHLCRICGTDGDHLSYLVREMMQGTHEEFEYFVCRKCGCLQIANIPEDLGKYYGDCYYSFSAKCESLTDDLNPAIDHRKILDVGCGAGAWLLQAAKLGYDNLFGCDPFIEHDIQYGDRVLIKKCTISEMEGEGTFQMIRMGDSFEHVPDPLETLQSAGRLLQDGGVIVMDIPTFPNIAFDMYGPHWYQLDAPRHLYLHSRSSIEYLADQSGLKVQKYEYNSNSSSIIRSYFYKNGVSYYDTTKELVDQHFSKEDMDSIERDCEECNRIGYGDHMAVYLTKK